MTRRINEDLLLVGSLPAESTEDALRLGGELFGDKVFALPDGETGDRLLWVMFEAFNLFKDHPDVEVLREQVPAPGMPEMFPANVWSLMELRFRDRGKEVRYETLPRIDAAIESYAVFKRLREEGVIPAGVRFQVCLPFPLSAWGNWFPDWDKDFPIHVRAYEEAMNREIPRLLEAIPAADLAIQWDVCIEVLDLERLYTNGSIDTAWDRFAGPCGRISRAIPEEVLLGHHLCYGTAPEWPMREAQDMGLIVRMANACVETSGRRVDWLHLAGPRSLRSKDESFFRPLQELRSGDARVFLGLVLPADGVDGLSRRVETASNYLEDFGVAMYCGFGRQPGQSALETLSNHRQVVDSFASMLSPSVD